MKNFYIRIFSKIDELLKYTDFDSLEKISKSLVSVNKKNKKILIFGNGGSAAISSHVSVDLTKNAKIRTVNFNESDLITCLSNDYGYNRWVKKSIDFYADVKDAVILISSSRNSMNMINACKAAKKKRIK